MNKDSTIYVAGSKTLIGAALVRQLRKHGYFNVFDGSEPNLVDTAAVNKFFSHSQPDYVFIAAGKSGGIEANRKYPASLMIDNLLVECNLIQAAHHSKVKKLLYLASSCCYPKFCPQPMQISSLMTGPLEPTNDSYAIAKIAGIKLCEAYRRQHESPFVVGIPANAFGPGDDFHPEDSHVIAALIRRIHVAKLHQRPSASIWGTGTPRREFVFAEDLADACIFVMQHYHDQRPINLGGGTDVSIKELAHLIKDITGYSGDLYFDLDKPDGMPLKVLDSNPLLAMGWQATTPLREALVATYHSFLQLNLESN